MHTIQHLLKWSLYTSAVAAMLVLTAVFALFFGLEILILLVQFSD